MKNKTIEEYLEKNKKFPSNTSLSNVFIVFKPISTERQAVLYTGKQFGLTTIRLRESKYYDPSQFTDTWRRTNKVVENIPKNVKAINIESFVPYWEENNMYFDFINFKGFKLVSPKDKPNESVLNDVYIPIANYIASTQ